MLLLWLSLALAGEPVAIPGTSVVMSPPPGFVLSGDYAGFHDPARGGTVRVFEFPAEARPELAATLVSTRVANEAFAEKGISFQRALSVPTPDGAARLVAGRTASRWPAYTALLPGDPVVLMHFIGVPGTLPLRDVRASLATARVSAPADLTTRLAALPFTFEVPPPFRPALTFGGNTALFTVGPLDVDPELRQPRLIVIGARLAGATAAAGACTETTRRIKGLEAAVFAEVTEEPGACRAHGTGAEGPNSDFVLHLRVDGEMQLAVVAFLPPDAPAGLTALVDGVAASLAAR